VWHQTGSTNGFYQGTLYAGYPTGDGHIELYRICK